MVCGLLIRRYFALLTVALTIQLAGCVTPPDINRFRHQQNADYLSTSSRSYPASGIGKPSLECRDDHGNTFYSNGMVCPDGPPTSEDKESDSPPTQPISPPASTSKPDAPPKGKLASTGSGYWIDTQGRAITNHHVIEGCNGLSIHKGMATVSAKLIADDPKSDLAVVRGNLSDIHPLKFRDGKSIRPADGVVAVGFPYAGILSASSQVTTGTVTSLSGVGDDSRFLQISAPIQPGNSGGPLLDMSGNLVGTIVSTLDPIVIAKATGSIPQNVNFAIKSGVVRDFLDANRIEYQMAQSKAKLDPADVGEIGEKSVVMVGCLK